MSTKKTIERISKSKRHRAAFVSSQISIGIPFQIRALRKHRKWDQKRLALEAGMLQPRISLMERPGYSNLSLDTLKKLAAAFDVALVVKFAPWGELIRWSDKFSPDDFQVVGFAEESAEFNAPSANVIAFNYLETVKDTGTVRRTQVTGSDYTHKLGNVVAPTIDNTSDSTAAIYQAA